MTDRKTPEIIVERVSHERVKDFYEAYVESLEELFEVGFISTTDPTSEELGSWEDWIKFLDEGWENDKEYHFQVIERSTDQVVGGVFLNRVQRVYQMANLGYWIRTSRAGEGFATEASRLAARYGFEKLRFQRLEIVVDVNHTSSLRIAEKLGAMREGLLRNRLQLHDSACDAYMHSLIPSDYGITKLSDIGTSDGDSSQW